MNENQTDRDYSYTYFPQSDDPDYPFVADRSDVYVAPTGVSAAAELLGGCGVLVRPAPANYDYATDLAAQRLEEAQKDFDEAERAFDQAHLRKLWAAQRLEAAFDAFHAAAESEAS
jgi:hypothetical protein